MGVGHHGRQARSPCVEFAAITVAHVKITASTELPAIVSAINRLRGSLLRHVNAPLTRQHQRSHQLQVGRPHHRGDHQMVAVLNFIDEKM